MGKVILIGAGPGDPDLLTIKAVKILRRADVVLVDDLVHPDILDHINPTARVIPVGKRGGCKSTPQAFIERLMAEEARLGKTVVRLKGGDPFVFGRGGEEREHLLAQGISVEVVNGITSGMAATTLYGIPLTHRDHSQGVIFVTGHGKDDATQPDWPALVASRMTLVIYMGMRRSNEIAQALQAAGMRSDMPVAIIQAAGTASQRGVRSTVADLPSTIARKGLGSPAIIVIGTVVDCGAALLEQDDAPRVDVR
ncbi:MAG: uroporphyrinogen-III C-methyltransferase [Burkholderiaceae bacterium]|nr:MAG: uroporphyrinogen-III C-methyltransferase [Burkholderiaceae bacterium]